MLPKNHLQPPDLNQYLPGEKPPGTGGQGRDVHITKVDIEKLANAKGI